MAWTYLRSLPDDAIDHHAGTVPPRSLRNGDVVIFDSGLPGLIVATAPRLFLLDTRSTPVFREPIEGDFGNCIFAQS